MIDNLFNTLRKKAEINERVMPKLEDFPIKDHNFLSVYTQTHIVTLTGLPTASLILQSVLMEMFVKLLYYHHKKQEFKDDLIDLINECHKEKLFSKEEQKNDKYFKFFDNFRYIIRNVQIHHLAKKLTMGMGVKGVKIEIPKKKDGSIDGESLFKAMREANENFEQKSELLSAEKHPFVANVLKTKIDEDVYLIQFCELIKVINELNKENNLDFQNESQNG